MKNFIATRILMLTHRLWNRQICRILCRAYSEGLVNSQQLHELTSAFDPTQNHIVYGPRVPYGFKGKRGVFQTVIVALILAAFAVSSLSAYEVPAEPDAESEPILHHGWRLIRVADEFHVQIAINALWLGKARHFWLTNDLAQLLANNGISSSIAAEVQSALDNAKDRLGLMYGVAPNEHHGATYYIVGDPNGITPPFFIPLVGAEDILNICINEYSAAASDPPMSAQRALHVHWIEEWIPYAVNDSKYGMSEIVVAELYLDIAAAILGTGTPEMPPDP